MFRVHSVSQRPNLRHLGEPVGGAKSLMEAVSFKKATEGNKFVTVDDFRGISISPVVSKVFEHCILARYEKFFTTSDNQFGFKKRSGCRPAHALYRPTIIIILLVVL